MGMDKQREQEQAALEIKRLCGVFGTPQPPEEEKALDKVKEPPRPYRSAGSVRSGEPEKAPPPCSFARHGVRGGAGADPGAHGRGGHF